MALNRWSLDRLSAVIGIVALLVLFIPMGVYLTYTVSSSVEESLSERGRGLVETLAGQIVEPVLLEDRLALHDALHKASSGDGDVRYLCVVNENGDILAHNLDEGYPPALSELWETRRGEVILFRTEDGPLMDVSAPLLDGQLGTVHVGISRSRATQAVNRLLWLMGIVLTATLSVILAGARIITAAVATPLRRLETAVSLFPQQAVDPDRLKVSGTREVESLAKGFTDMIQRLEFLERDREATQGRLVHTERLAALGELAAGLAHEIHNPLGGMQQCLGYLERDPVKSERAAKYYPLFRDGLQRIAGTMQGMLAFARYGQNVSIEECRVADMLEALELLVQADMRGRSVRLTWQKSPEDCKCLCNPQGLSQAGLNLVLNAAEAAEAGADPRVRIGASCDSQWVYICVEDSGPGVPEELRERVFDAFFTTKPLGKGTGLGLSVSRQLLRAAGGELELSPEPGSLGGARFVIRLPKVQDSKPQDDRKPSENPDR